MALRFPARAFILIAPSLSSAGALAFDRGQYGESPSCIREWFKGVKRVAVPTEAVVDDSGNPTGQAVVWCAIYGDPGKPYIRCFVPGAGL